MLQQQSSIIITETLWPIKAETFTLFLFVVVVVVFQKIFADPDLACRVNDKTKCAWTHMSTNTESTLHSALLIRASMRLHLKLVYKCPKCLLVNEVLARISKDYKHFKCPLTILIVSFKCMF